MIIIMLATVTLVNIDKFIPAQVQWLQWLHALKHCKWNPSQIVVAETSQWNKRFTKEFTLDLDSQVVSISCVVDPRTLLVCSVTSSDWWWNQRRDCWLKTLRFHCQQSWGGQRFRASKQLTEMQLVVAPSNQRLHRLPQASWCYNRTNRDRADGTSQVIRLEEFSFLWVKLENGVIQVHQRWNIGTSFFYLFM